MENTESRDQIHHRLHSWLQAQYAEQVEYVYVLPNFLQVGMQRFNEDLTTCRRWADRILAQLEQARRYRNIVDEIRQATEDAVGFAVVNLLSDPDAKIPKLLKAAEQRQTWARQSCEKEIAEARRWESLHEEFRAFIRTSEDKFKHLLNAKNDLRSQLWAYRLHGMLGELHQEALQLEDESRPIHQRTSDQAGPTDVFLPVQSPFPQPPTPTQSQPFASPLFTKEPK